MSKCKKVQEWLPVIHGMWFLNASKVTLNSKSVP
jgi:hypothetical protein